MTGIFSYSLNSGKPSLPKVSKHEIVQSLASVVINPDEKLEEAYVPIAPKVKPAAPISDEVTDMQRPDIPFLQCYQFLATLPTLQNSVLAEIDNIIGRDWYYAAVAGDDTEKPNGKEIGSKAKEAIPQQDPVAQEYIKYLNKWETEFELERIFEYLITDWSTCGNCLLGISDWQPVMLGRVEGCVRNEVNGSVIKYWFIKTTGERLPLDAKNFIHSRYFDVDREPWSLAKFHALFNNNFTDPDIKKPKPLAAIIRVMLQDAGKIHHKFAMPRILYGFKDVSKEVFEQDIVPSFNKIAQGGRGAFNKEFTVNQENVDGTARFTESIDLINDQMEAGSGSSVNRVQTKASALADANVAASGTDDRYVGDMDRLRRLMNNDIIPRVIAQKKNDLDNWKQYRGMVEFRWGAKDSFEFNPDEALKFLGVGVYAKKEVREMLKAAGRPVNDEWYDAEQEQRAADENQKFQRVVEVKNAGQKAPDFKAKEDVKAQNKKTTA